MPVRRNPDKSISFLNAAGQETGRWAGRRLTPLEILNIVSKHFPETEWVTAVAVCLGESSGYVGTLGDLLLVDNTYGPSVGLFQVRSLKEPGTTQRDYLALLDPEVNVKFAYMLWSTKGWKPWGAYTSGGYKQSLVKANLAVGDYFTARALPYYKAGGK